MVSQVSLEGYRAARTSAVVIDRSHRGRLVVSGADRTSYLQGLLTNDITALAPGQGCYAAYLTPQGRMIADLLVYELGDLILLSMVRGVKDVVLMKLNQLIFTEDVQLGDATETFAEFGVVGPEAARVLGALLDDAVADVLGRLPEHGNLRAQFCGHPVIVTQMNEIGEAGYDVYVERPHAELLQAALAAAGTPKIDESTADTVRIEAGIPAFHRDMDEETIPLEAGIESRAISFTKGCYVGQEVIIRVLHRGHGRVARKLVGLLMDGDSVPTPGEAVRVDEREIGRVTSSAMSPALKRPIALAYVHRDFVAPGTAVTVGGARGVVSELPFVRGTV